MISVCVPVYNADVRSLAHLLYKQAGQLAVPVELVFIDDGSDEHFRKINQEVHKFGRYIELYPNIGRARIRNLFLKYAVYNYLLFLDCDAQIISNDFLENYLSAIPSDYADVVICGGKIYPDEKPGRNRRLRWRYGILKESFTAKERRRFPNRSFMSNNFLISRQLLVKFPFDESLSGYGHEDTLFGFNLKKNNINIVHIDNPVMNGELETNQEFLSKVNQSLFNLKRTLEITGYDQNYINDNKLLRFYYGNRWMRCLFIPVLGMVHPVIRILLARGFVSIWLLNIYKYRMFVKQMR
ncbi:glycosyltransferase family 2 protein [Anaerophaga thermohalophila]|uniref:glycosyltransferase family 2 protein n=1 Tax=Anaerophaga thermohalophila TaxID=177400 RepID=UPI000237CA53|nr:glycosyltransferase family 2 protein [Anaerophaga thermohalophila]